MSGEVESVGKRSDYPESAWGWRDRARELQHHEIGKPLSGPPPAPRLTFSIFERPTRDAARSWEVDRVLERFGVRKRGR